MALTWRGITICDESSYPGLSGYVVSGYSPEGIASVDISILGANGRYQRAMGTRISDETSARVLISGLIGASSASVLTAKIDELETACADYRRALGSLVYSWPMTASPRTITNARIIFQPTAFSFLQYPIQKLLNGTFVMGFNLDAVQVSPD